MKTCSIATAKRQFSRLMHWVKQGQTVMITERNKPVATLQPIHGPSVDGVVGLCVGGGVLAPRRKLDISAFLSAPRIESDSEHSLLRAVLEERE